MKPLRFILASSSPRRSFLLREFGYIFDTESPDVEEITDQNASPEQLVLINAQIKARAVAKMHPHALILAADTVVAFEGQIFGKPASFSDAQSMLATLNAKSHQVFSGVCILPPSPTPETSFTETTVVHFRNLSPEAQTRYLERIHPLDKAGAYAAQDDQGELIASFEGSFTNVIGLPMERLNELLLPWAPTICRPS